MKRRGFRTLGSLPHFKHLNKVSIITKIGKIILFNRKTNLFNRKNNLVNRKNGKLAFNLNFEKRGNDIENSKLDVSKGSSLGRVRVTTRKKISSLFSIYYKHSIEKSRRNQ